MLKTNMKEKTLEKVKVTKDFSPEMREQRKLLIEQMIAMASSNHDFRCVVMYDKLIINSVWTMDNKLNPVT